jgi:DNA-binding CsgD family transcriptional regulator
LSPRDLSVRFDALVAGHGGVLVVEGEPGIGKSTALELLCRTGAEVSGATVLRSVGSEAERHVALAGLASLIAPVEHLLGDDQRAQVLRRALLSGQATATLSLGLAVLDLWSSIEVRTPLVVVVDDGQWVDDVSAEVLAFAARRRAGRITVVIAVRTGEPHPFGHLPTVRLGGVDVDTAARILGLRVTVPPSVVVAEAHRACAGNPLALHELATILAPDQRVGLAPLPDPVPAGPDLVASMGVRLARLPLDTQRSLEVLAACGEASSATLDAALAFLDPPLRLVALEAAEAAGIIEVGQARIRFRHPLLRSVGYARASGPARRAAHRAIAHALPIDDLRRAWHLADAADGPDAEAEHALAELGARAAANGAHGLAARAAARAADVAPDVASAADHLVDAAEAYWEQAQPETALPLLDRALGLAESGPVRARARIVRAHVAAWTRSLPGAVNELVDVGVVLAPTAPGTAGMAMVSAATFASMAGECERGVELARRAAAIAESADDMSRFGVRAMGAFAHLVNGRGVEAADALGELDLAAAFVGPSSPRELFELGQIAGFAQLLQERWVDAGATLAAVADGGRRLALEGVANFAHAMRAEIWWRTGRWTEARAEALVDVTHNTALPAVIGSFGHASLARVEAGLGLTESARENAQIAMEQGRRTGMAMLEGWARHAVGLADLADGRLEQSAVHFDWIARVSRRAGWADPGPLWWHGDHLEVLLALGHRDEARRFVDGLEPAAERLGRAYAKAVVARGRASLDGDPAAARRSVELLDALGAPFEAARSRLVLAALVDGDERSGLLRVALEVFESLGASPWERRLRALEPTAGRLGAARRATTVNIAAVLTPAEARVALAVGEGLTNQQAAEQLYLGVKTVETHLSSVYRKLGVRSRTELVLLLRGSA